MASLTHVCVWSKNGWKRITPEEVAREHSRGGVSARSGIFMCSLCGQYVTFFNGRVQAPHFRHSSAEADKSCPERMYVHGYDYTYAAGEHELPIRIVNVTDYGFEFELGLLAVPRIVLNQQEKKNVTVIPSDKAMTPFVYSFERLNAESITYVSIGEYPCESYTVATVYKGNIIKNLIMDCQSYTKYRPNETTGGIFVSWRRKEELPTGA